MKTVVFTCLLGILLTPTGLSQDLFHESYDWEEEPEWQELSEEESEEGAVVLKANTIVEFAYDEKYEGNLVENRTIHGLIRLNNDDAIDANNKIYISMYKVVELVEAKARVIKPSGEIINFDESNIKTNEEVESIGGLKYFAIEGIEKGANIEYMYTVKKVPLLDGSVMTVQGSAPTKNTMVKVISPNNLFFTMRSYNGLPQIERDTLDTLKNTYTLEIEDLPKLKSEPYSTYDKNLQYFVYKLDYNAANGVGDFYTFAKVSQMIFNNTHPELSKSELKQLNKIIKESGVTKIEDEEEKVRALEFYLKTNYQIIDGAPTESISKILSDKYTSGLGMMTLFTSTLTLLDIKYEIGVTCDRFDMHFDPEFEHYRVLNDYFIYFPKIKKFLTPEVFGSRLGFLPYELTGHNGLFIKKMNLGDDFTTGLGKVKMIPPLSYKENYDDMDIEIDLSDMSAPIVKYVRSMNGYSAVNLQAVYEELETDSKKELDELFTKFPAEDGEVISYEVSGVGPADIAVKPIVYTGSVKAPSLIEKAANRYVFKIGEVIGAQSEMYDEEERQSEIVNDFNRAYNRVIKMPIPDGYKVSNLEEIKIHEAFPAEDPVILFDSDYTVEDDVITITITEYYDQLSFPKEQIDEFRSVINAAANFNKVVLFMEKE